MKKLAGIVTLVALFAFVSNVYACGEKDASSKASSKSGCCAKSAKVSTEISKSDGTQITTAKAAKTGSGSNCLMANKEKAGSACGTKSTKINASSEKAEVSVKKLEKNSPQLVEAVKSKKEIVKDK